VTVTVSPRGSAPSEYDFEVVRTRPFSSVFAGLAVAGAVTEAAQSSGRASVGLSATLETTRGPVTYRAVFQTAEPALRAGGELAALLDVVMDGAFEGVEVTGASLLVEIDGGEFLDVIEGVTADRAVYRPGDQVRLVVSLRDRDGARTERAFALLVPEGTPRGWLTVRIGGASSFHEWDAERLGQGLRPRTWDQMRELIESSLPGNTVVAQLLSGRQGLSLSGSEMGRVPGKAALVMGSVRQSGTVVPAELTVLSGQSFRTDSEAVGFHEFIVYVDPDE